jgi:hypothetical protein
MVWRSDTRMIYILYGDGSYEIFSDLWVAGEEINVGETPPAPLVAPVRGFGKLWLTEPRVRQGLGWATINETAFSTVVETVVEDVWRVPIFGTYFRLPTNQVATMAGNRWEMS